MVYLHPYDIDAETPVIGRWGFFRLMRYAGLQGAEKKIRQLLTEFTFGSIAEHHQQLAHRD